MYITLHSLLLQEARGALAQVVEQWTENPCVPGSTPGGTTFKRLLKRKPHEIQIFHGVSFLHGPLKKHNSLIYNFFAEREVCEPNSRISLYINFLYVLTNHQCSIFVAVF